MTSISSTAAGLTLVSAGAGSGKTQRLTTVVTEAVDPRGAAPVPLDGLVAVTYTRKAATELEARVRQTLIASGSTELACELPLARLGTVHAVCLRWLRELALDAGLSPLADVLPGDEATALRQALEAGLPPELSHRLDELAEHLAIRWDSRTKRWDWQQPVQEVMTLARSNRIPPAALREMSERASRRLRALLGSPETDPIALDAELEQGLDEALTALAHLDSGPKKLQQARQLIATARQRLASGDLPWPEWVALQKVDAGKAGRDSVARLVHIALRVDAHPRLHSQLHDFILAVYEAASIGLTVYSQWKQERRLVDFVDMVDRSLTLLDAANVRAELEQRLSLCVVDEFQDTSPAQLALFVRLHELCGRSTWVGDPKQCIFEYAGADPELMDAVTSWVGRSSGSTEVLLDNWRSRPELVEACSRLFGAAFARDGYSPEQVAMAARRPLAPALTPLPPFGVWWLEGRHREQTLNALAEGVARMLGDPLATTVMDRVSGAPRALRPGDIAILVATNAEAGTLTSALARRGLRAAVARAGLLDTPEGTLVQAALSYVAEPRDTRSLAVIEALTDFEGQSPGLWLEAKLIERQRFLHARERNDGSEHRHTSSVAIALEPLRRELPILGPAEALDRALGALDVASLCARWPNPEQRLANLEALRALAARYETHCQHEREAASVAGLLRYFDSSRRAIDDAENASDHQHATRGHDTITVTTYHRAKGLEWPVVILGSLDREERRDAFSVQPVSAREAFDPTDPLGGRWIRYFPWPYGRHRSAPLADAVANAEEGQHVRHREARERVRLLYVGFTRARDHLVLAVRPGRQRPNTPWLDELCDGSGAALLSLPAQTPQPADDNVSVRGLDETTASFSARTWTLSAEGAPSQLAAPDSSRWFARPPRPTEPPTQYGISPSRGQRDWPELESGQVGDIVDLGGRLPLGSRSPKDWSRVGDVVHAFLAADLHELSAQRRLACAERLLRASQLLELLEPSALIRASDQLRAWIDDTWPGATWHRELPVRAIVATPRGSRRIEGIIDLLLEVPAGVVLIDHKSYPGRRDTWRERAQEYAPQLAAYAQALRMAGRHVLSQWISFVVTGGAVPVNLPST